MDESHNQFAPGPLIGAVYALGLGVTTALGAYAVVSRDADALNALQWPAFALAAGLATALGGLGLLLRKRWVTWKQALAWGLAVGALESVTYLGFWPLLWMQYDTAVSATNFTIQHLGLALVQFLAIAAMTKMATPPTSAKYIAKTTGASSDR